MQTNRIDLKGCTPDEIEQYCTQNMSQKPGQGTRVAIQLFRKKIEEIEGMVDLNLPFREQLTRHCTISSLTVQDQIVSSDGTRKLLYALDDGNTVEGVIIPGTGDRVTLCVSTQVGCSSGCTFCLTGSGGLTRNLTVAEMVNQVFAAQKLSDLPLTNIVLMGTGEPLSNYQAVKSFIRILIDRDGMGYSPKKITLSTCGLAPAIERMPGEIDASLAVSLNAATDEIRDSIMPVNRTYPLARLVAALRYYSERTGNSITIEYVLFKGINDSDRDAIRLMKLLNGIPCMINILMFNPFPGAAFERPDENRVYAFRNFLLNHGFVAVVRSSRGRDIHAACGQLRAMPRSG